MNAYEFLIDVERKIEALAMDEYRLRNTLESKRLIEEILPIAKLAISLKQPGLEISVEAFEDSGEYDGLIVESGFRETKLPIQVTYCYSYEQSLRDEEVEITGFSWGSGPISRNQITKGIESSPKAQASNEHLVTTAREISSIITKKSEKCYATKMVLIVAFFNFQLCSLGWWSELLKELELTEVMTTKQFSRIYLYNEASNEIYRIA